MDMIEEKLKKLRASEACYRRLFETAKDGILIMEFESGRIVDVNPSLIKMIGDSKGNLLGRQIWELGPFESIQSVKEEIKNLKENDYIRYENMAIKGMDGKTTDVEFVSSVYAVDGVKLVQCIIRDITERTRREKIDTEKTNELEIFSKAAVGRELKMIDLEKEIKKREILENQLRESEELYKALIKASPDSVTVTNLEGHIIDVSDRTLKLHGYGDVRELKGKDSMDLIAPEDHERVKSNFETIFRDGLVKDVECKMLRKDGTNFQGLLNAAVVKDASGKPKAFIATVREKT